MEAHPHPCPRRCPGCLHRNQRVFKAFPLLIKTSAFPFLFLLPGRCWCSGRRHCWVLPGMVLAQCSHPNHLLGGLWPNWEQCGQHPHPWGHPVLGVSLGLEDTPSLGSLILGVTHPWGHSCSQTPISNAPFCCRCFCSTNPEASRPKSGLRAAVHGVVSCCAAHTLPSPIPLAFCPLFFFFLKELCWLE